MVGQTINWLFIFLGFGIGIPAGIGFEKTVVWYRRTRAGMRLAMPAVKLAAQVACGIGLVLALGVWWVWPS